jgi:hypothetical protein
LFFQEILQIFEGFFDHDNSFEESLCFFHHKIFDHRELVPGFFCFSAVVLEMRYPVGDDSKEICFLSDFYVEFLVGPELVAEVLEEGQHFDVLNFLEADELLEEEGEGGRVDNLEVVGHDLVEHSQ